MDLTRPHAGRLVSPRLRARPPPPPWGQRVAAHGLRCLHAGLGVCTRWAASPAPGAPAAPGGCVGASGSWGCLGPGSGAPLPKPGPQPPVPAHPARRSLPFAQKQGADRSRTRRLRERGGWPSVETTDFSPSTETRTHIGNERARHFCGCELPLASVHGAQASLCGPST